MAGFVKTACTRDTWDSIWSVLVWSLMAMYTGIHPVTKHDGTAWPPGSYGGRHAGQPLTNGGHRCIVHRIVGDLDWFQKSLGLRFAPAANSPCAFCSANRTDMPFLHLQPHAAWVGTPHAPLPGHRLFTLPGVSMATIALDLMHTCDLGILQQFIGSCFYVFIYHSSWPGTIAYRLQRLWDAVKASYEALGSSCRLTNLRLSMFLDEGRPHQGPVCLSAAKAMEARQLLPVCVRLCNLFSDGGEVHQNMLHCGERLQTLCEIFGSSGHFINNHDDVMRNCWEASESYMKLSFWSATNGLHSFNLVNKHHMFIHLCLQAAFLNPESTWTYPYEDLVGRIQRVAMGSKSGLQSLALGRQLITKYRRIIHRALLRVDA